MPLSCASCLEPESSIFKDFFERIEDYQALAKICCCIAFCPHRKYLQGNQFLPFIVRSARNSLPSCKKPSRQRGPSGCASCVQVWGEAKSLEWSCSSDTEIHIGRIKPKVSSVGRRSGREQGPRHHRSVAGRGHHGRRRGKRQRKEEAARRSARARRRPRLWWDTSRRKDGRKIRSKILNGRDVCCQACFSLLFDVLGVPLALRLPPSEQGCSVWWQSQAVDVSVCGKPWAWTEAL